MTKISDGDLFVGRGDELRRLDAFVDALSRGAGRVVTVKGSGGIGKTRLMREFIAILSGCRISIGAACAYEGEESRPLDIWKQISGSLRVSQASGSLQQEPKARLAECFAETRSPPDGTEDERSSYSSPMWERVLNSVVDLGRKSPTVLLIDNVQWADTASLRVLIHIAQMIGEIPLLLVITYRPEEILRKTVLQRLVVELSKSANHCDVRLEPLTAEDVTEYYASVADHNVLRRSGVSFSAAASRLHARSEGNPLFMVELSRTDEFTNGISIGYGNIPETLEASIRLKLSQADAETTRFLGVAACLGRSFSTDTLAEVSHGSSGAIHSAVREGVALSLIDPVDRSAGTYQFSHALIQQHIAEGLPPNERRSYHLAEVKRIIALEESGSQVGLAQLMRHMTQAMPLVSPREITERALRATKSSHNVLEPDVIVDVLEIAVKALEVQRQNAVLKKNRADLLRCLVEAYGDMYLPDEAIKARKDAFDLYEELGLIREMVRAAVAVTPYVPRDDFYIAVSRVGGYASEELVVRAKRHVSPGSLDEAYLILAGAPYDEETCEVVLKTAQAHGDQCLELEVYSYLVNKRARSTNPEKAHEMYERVWLLWSRVRGDLACFRGTYWAIVAAYKEGNLQKAKETITRLKLLAQVSKTELHESAVLQHEANFARYSGNLDRWEMVSQQLLSATKNRRISWQYNFALLDLSAIYLFRGAISEAWKYIDRLNIVSPKPDLRWGSRVALYIRLSGDTSKASEVVEIIESTRKGSFAWQYIRQLLVFTETFIAVATKDRSIAERLLADEDFEDTQLFDPPGLSISHPYQLHALLLDLMGQHKNAWQRLEQAIEWLRRAQFKTVLGWVCLDYAESLTTGGREREAAPLVLEGERIAEETGMIALADKFRKLKFSAPALKSELDAARLQEPSSLILPHPDGLTPREIKIVIEISYGYTNKEIGQRLHISHHTVGRHVQNILAKTGMSNRTELAAYALSKGISG